MVRLSYQSRWVLGWNSTRFPPMAKSFLCVVGLAFCPSVTSSICCSKDRSSSTHPLCQTSWPRMTLWLVKTLWKEESSCFTVPPKMHWSYQQWPCTNSIHSASRKRSSLLAQWESRRTKKLSGTSSRA